MGKNFKIFLTLLVLISHLAIDTYAAEKNASKKGKQAIKVVWDEPEKIVRGGYPRVHRLNDGRLMMCYSLSANIYVRFSDDDGYTWTEDPQVVMRLQILSLPNCLLIILISLGGLFLLAIIVR